MEDEDDDFKNRLNNMRVQEFRQGKEDILVGKVFKAMKKRHNLGRKHYEAILRCKVFQGLMLSRIQIEEFAARLENVYVGMLLKTHLKAMKEFKVMKETERQQNFNRTISVIKQRQFNFFSTRLRKLIEKKKMQKLMKEAERQQNINLTISMIKQIQFNFFSTKLRKLIEKKKMQKVLKAEENQLSELKYRTDQQVYLRDPQPSAPRLNYSRHLEDSRKSIYSGLSVASEFAMNRRKFNAVKQLPKMPTYQTISKVQVSNKIEEQQEKRCQNEEKSSLPEQKKQKPEQDKKDESVEDIELKQKQRQNLLKPQQKVKQKKVCRNEVISLLSQLKIFEINALTEIIQDHSTTLKGQSLLSEKNMLNQSYSTLLSLSKLQ